MWPNRRLAKCCRGATHQIIHERRDFSERVSRKRHIARPGIQKNTAFNMYRPDAISSTPPAVSKKRRCGDSPRKFSSHPTATAPSTSGTARPMAKASNSTTPRTTEPSPAVTPSNTTSAGVHTGQTATAKGMPSRNAPASRSPWTPSGCARRSRRTSRRTARSPPDSHRRRHIGCEAVF